MEQRITILVDGGEAHVTQASNAVGVRSPDNSVRVSQTGGGSFVVKDYNGLDNKPSIENVVLQGNRSITEFGPSLATNQDIINLFR